MSGAAPLDALAEAYGIMPGFRDLAGKTCPTLPETKHALLRAMGLALDNDAMVAEALAEVRAARLARACPQEVIIESGCNASLRLASGAEWRLEIEAQPGATTEGRAQDENAALPPLPSGIHILSVKHGHHTETVTIIAAPRSCPSIETACGRKHSWGVNAALYALRSSRNHGLGDFEDLASAAEIIGSHGASFLGINPVHSIGWSDTETISPYSPSHRGFLNSSHIATDRTPILRENNSVRDLAGNRTGEVEDGIRYSEILPAQKALLESLYTAFQAGADRTSQAAFSEFCDSSGAALSDFALYEALSEVNGPDWRAWPAAIQNPSAPEVSAGRRSLSGRIQFHQWLQWVADSQLADAHFRARQHGMGLGLYLDLAVGPRRGAAEAWCEQEAIAQGVALGAPPDHLSPDGQNWQLAGYAPQLLAQQGYRPLRRIIAANMRHAGMLRIDHILGMNRSYWIPDDGAPGGYIRQPFGSLLAIVAIEAERTGTIVIGEDLGLVPEGFREALRSRGLYGYSVLQYERDKDGRLQRPSELRENSLLCFGTHDTATLKGFWAGRDIDWWRKLGWMNDFDTRKARTQRERDKQALLNLERTYTAPLPNRQAFSDAKREVHAAMAASPAAMVSVQLDDLCNQSEAQNLPGTIDEHPNWRRRCPVPVERFGTDLGLCEVGEIMRACGRSRDHVEGELP